MATEQQTVPGLASCVYCDGKGWTPGKDGFTPDDCLACNGTGFLPAAVPADAASRVYELERACEAALAALAWAEGSAVAHARRVLRGGLGR